MLARTRRTIIPAASRILETVLSREASYCAVVAERTKRFYLEDLYVGQRFTSASYLMEAARIKQFAAEFDPQPFHLDEGAAEASVFGGLAASGWHTAAVAMRLLVTSDLRLANGILGLGGEIAWPLPTRPGDTLHVESEIIEIRPSRSKPYQGIVTVRSTMLNQNGEAVYLMTARLLVPRRPM
jgi:acyl dehydratase